VQFLRKTVLKLEWVQLAESISFVRQAYFRGNLRCYSDGNIHFETSFDPSLGLPATSISEQQLLKMNSWREQSLLSFYNAAVKSPYSHIANNVLEKVMTVCRIREYSPQ